MSATRAPATSGFGLRKCFAGTNYGLWRELRSEYTPCMCPNMACALLFSRLLQQTLEGNRMAGTEDFGAKGGGGGQGGGGGGRGPGGGGGGMGGGGSSGG